MTCAKTTQTVCLTLSVLTIALYILRCIWLTLVSKVINNTYNNRVVVKHRHTLVKKKSQKVVIKALQR